MTSSQGTDFNVLQTVRRQLVQLECIALNVRHTEQFLKRCVRYSPIGSLDKILYGADTISVSSTLIYLDSLAPLDTRTAPSQTCRQPNVMASSVCAGAKLQPLVACIRRSIVAALEVANMTIREL